MSKSTVGTAEETKKRIDAAKAAEGLKKEATGEVIEPVDITVDVNGEEMTFSCPPSIEDAPADVIFHMEDEKPMKAFRVLLGEENLGRMRNAGARVKDFTHFIEAWTEEVGLGK